jgi:small multidrug resistance family-3 protein
MTVVRSIALFVLAAVAEIADGFRPDRYDVVGALVCLVGVAIIMYAPRPA